MGAVHEIFTVIDVHEYLDKEKVRKYFLTHVMPQKFRTDEPDGVYDRQERDHKWRDIVVNGCTLYTISKMWLDRGGPENLHPVFRQPWGTFSKKEP